MVRKFAVSKQEHPGVGTQVNSSLGHIIVTKRTKTLKGQFLHGNITLMFDSKNIFMGILH